MKLLTKEILERTPGLYSKENDGKDAMAEAKFFTPWSSWTWFMFEYDPNERVAFGFVTSNLCPEGELGYFSLDELEALQGPGGMKVERDVYWKPTKYGELKESAERGRFGLD